jgi:hypothetical protein
MTERFAIDFDTLTEVKVRIFLPEELQFTCKPSYGRWLLDRKWRVAYIEVTHRRVTTLFGQPTHTRGAVNSAFRQEFNPEAVTEMPDIVMNEVLMHISRLNLLKRTQPDVTGLR